MPTPIGLLAAGARIQTSRSSPVVRLTAMALGWIGSTPAFGAVVRKPYTRCGPGIGFDLVPRSPLNSVQMPANANRDGSYREQPDDVLLFGDGIRLWRIFGKT